MHIQIDIGTTMLSINICKVYFVQDDIHIRVHSPTDTSRTFSLREETNEATIINSQYDDKVLYAAPAHTVIVPHQASAAGEQYAVSTKAVNKKNKEKPLKEEPPQEDVDIGQSKEVETVSTNTYVAKYVGIG